MNITEASAILYPLRREPFPDTHILTVSDGVRTATVDLHLMGNLTRWERDEIVRQFESAFRYAWNCYTADLDVTITAQFEAAEDSEEERVI